MLTANPLRTRSGMLFLFIGVVAVGLLLFGLQQRAQPRDVDLSTLLADLRGDIAHRDVDTLIVNASTLELGRASGATEQANIDANFQVSALKRDYNIDYADPSVLHYKVASPGLLAVWGNLLFTL